MEAMAEEAMDNSRDKIEAEDLDMDMAMVVDVAVAGIEEIVVDIETIGDSARVSFAWMM